MLVAPRPGVTDLQLIKALCIANPWLAEMLYMRHDNIQLNLLIQTIKQEIKIAILWRSVLKSVSRYVVRYLIYL